MQKAWNDYAGLMEKSHPRVFSTLQQHKPTMNTSGKIQILLNSNAQRENFAMSIKPGLTRYFRENLANMEYEFETKLIQTESNGKKVYTDHDKLEYMIQKNEDLEKMKARYNLDFDN
jgi:DNA polymerase-3 subunit gamma/tau